MIRTFCDACGKEIPDNDDILTPRYETHEERMARLGEGHLCVSVEQVVKRGEGLCVRYLSFCEECENRLVEAVRKVIGNG